MLEYLGLCWAILGCGGYNSVTVFVTAWPEPCNHLGGGRKDDPTEFDVSLSLSQTYYFYRKSLELATGEIDRIHLEIEQLKCLSHPRNGMTIPR
jgi:hypothetical protein